MNPLRHRRRQNLALAGMVLALGGWWAWTASRPQETLRLISDLPVRQVRSIRIERIGRPPIRLGLHPDGRWWMEAPVEIPADAGRLDSLARLPAKVSFGAYAWDRVRPGELGLDPPLATVVFNGGRVSVGIGRVNPLNERRYVRVADAVHLVTDTIGDLYAENPGALMDRHLVPPGGRIVGLEIPGLRIRPAPQGGWQAEPGPADPRLPVRLVRRWLTDPALAVVWRPGERLEADGEARLALADGRILDFEIVPQTKGAYLVRRDLPLYYRLSPAGLRRLFEGGHGAAVDPDRAGPGPQ